MYIYKQLLYIITDSGSESDNTSSTNNTSYITVSSGDRKTVQILKLSSSQSQSLPFTVKDVNPEVTSSSKVAFMSHTSHYMPGGMAYVGCHNWLCRVASPLACQKPMIMGWNPRFLLIMFLGLSPVFMGSDKVVNVPKA